jgi:hypothetical protein
LKIIVYHLGLIWFKRTVFPFKLNQNKSKQFFCIGGVFVLNSSQQGQGRVMLLTEI